MAWCLLQDKGMITRLCKKTIYHLNYLSNIFQTKSLWDMTPLEKLTGRKPLLGHFKKFERIACIHILDDKRKKLDEKMHAFVLWCTTLMSQNVIVCLIQ